MAGPCSRLRYARESFFAARSWRDLDDLNTQAQAWCDGIAADRPCPEDRSMSVREAFEQERSSLVALPGDRFPADERVEVSPDETETSAVVSLSRCARADVPMLALGR